MPPLLLPRLPEVVSTMKIITKMTKIITMKTMVVSRRLNFNRSGNEKSSIEKPLWGMIRVNLLLRRRQLTEMSSFSNQ
jgi:hypothetical protein